MSTDSDQTCSRIIKPNRVNISIDLDAYEDVLSAYYVASVYIFKLSNLNVVYTWRQSRSASIHIKYGIFCRHAYQTITWYLWFLAQYFYTVTTKNLSKIKKWKWSAQKNVPQRFLESVGPFLSSKNLRERQPFIQRHMHIYSYLIFFTDDSLSLNI